jgi:hypothetical protein
MTIPLRIKCRAIAVVIVMGVFLALVPSAYGAPKEANQPLKCTTGPITKMYGGAQWLVYSCDDGRSVVVISAPGNPAMPSQFTLSPQGEEYQLSGEGSGNADATAAAVMDLKALSSKDINSLIQQTKAAKH